jgi:hypothetical protein
MKLKRTDGQARRNMPKRRSEMISNMGSSYSEYVTVSDGDVFPALSGVMVRPICVLLDVWSPKRPSKREHAIESMAQTMNETGTATISKLQEQL